MERRWYKVSGGRINIGGFRDMFPEGFVYVIPDKLKIAKEYHVFLLVSSIGTPGKETKIRKDGRIHVPRETLEKSGLSDGMDTVYIPRSNNITIWNPENYREFIRDGSEYVKTLKGRDRGIFNSILDDSL